MTTLGLTQASRRLNVESAQNGSMVRQALLTCGILSALLYAAMLVFVALQWEGYSSASQTVSELSAIGAPTRALWVMLGIVWTVLVVAFGFGIRVSALGNRALGVAGGLLIASAVFGLAWPPMHQREVLAAGGGTLTDTLHIVWTAVTGLFTLAAMGFAASAFGKRFRLYTIASMVILVAFGVLSGMDAPRMQANLSTPWVGVWERINIGAQMLWMAVLAVVLLRRRVAATQPR
jgi:hypothetical protein